MLVMLISVVNFLQKTRQGVPPWRRYPNTQVATLQKSPPQLVSVTVLVLALFEIEGKGSNSHPSSTFWYGPSNRLRK